MFQIIILSTFICVTSGSIGLCWLILRRGNPIADRLKSVEKPKEQTGQMAEPEDNLAERVAKPLNRLAPPSLNEAQKLQKQLLMAGYFSREAPLIYRAIQMASMFGFPLLVMVICVLLSQSI